MSVLTTRNGMRRCARSVIAPRTGDATKINPIEIAVMTPYTKSARSAPTWSRTQVEKYTDTTPIEKMVLARSYRTQLATARVGMTLVWLGDVTTTLPGPGLGMTEGTMLGFYWVPRGSTWFYKVRSGNREPRRTANEPCRTL